MDTQAPGEILDRMTDAFFALDGEWRLTYVNEAARPILTAAMDREPADVTLEGRHLWEAIPDAVGTPFYEKYHEAMETQEPVSVEAHYGPLDRWFEARAYPSESGLSVYLRDVTEQRRRRETLERRERAFREMYGIVADRERSLPDQVEALLALGREILDVDYGTLSRREGEEYVFEVVDADDDTVEAGDVVPLSATNCEIAIASAETLVLEDVARDAPEETDRTGYAEWGIACYLGAPVFVDGDVYGTFCFYDTEPRAEEFSEWDVTLVELMSQWVGAKIQRREDRERLQRQNARLDRFATIVSHDLRNPLNAAEGHRAIAAEVCDSDHLERVEAAHERMETLIDDLLSLSRSGTMVDETAPVDVGSLAEECWEALAVDGATLRVEDAPTVEADAERLRQLLANLLSNAVDHGSGDRSATGDADGPPDRPSAGDDGAGVSGSDSDVTSGSDSDATSGVTVTVGTLADAAGFYVADDGPGVPEADRDQVFEGGYTTAEDGTGFGLAIVAEVAAAHGWSVRVVEGDEGGARFEVTGAECVDE